MPERSSNDEKRPKRPRDTNQLARSVFLEAIGEAPEPQEKQEDGGPKKNPAAVALGRLGGKKGGKARAAKLSPERRREIAKKAAAARWGKASEGG